MKAILIMLGTFYFTGCTNSYDYKTIAIYQAQSSNLKIDLVATGNILKGHDLDDNGVVNGRILSPKLSDTIFFKADESTFSVTFYKYDSIKSKNLSLKQFFNSINYTEYNTNEIKELEHIIKAAAYGPEGTYTKGQTKDIKVINVDFTTN